MYLKVRSKCSSLISMVWAACLISWHQPSIWHRAKFRKRNYRDIRSSSVSKIRYIWSHAEMKNYRYYPQKSPYYTTYATIFSLGVKALANGHGPSLSRFSWPDTERPRTAQGCVWKQARYSIHMILSQSLSPKFHSAWMYRHQRSSIPSVLYPILQHRHEYNTGKQRPHTKAKGKTVITAFI